MSKPRQEFLGPITKLAAIEVGANWVSDGRGIVDGYGAEVKNIAAVVLNARTSHPATGAGKGAYWINNNTNPNLPYFTDNNGGDHNLLDGGGGGGVPTGELNTVLWSNGTGNYWTNDIILGGPSSSPTIYFGAESSDPVISQQTISDSLVYANALTIQAQNHLNGLGGDLRLNGGNINNSATNFGKVVLRGREINLGSSLVNFLSYIYNPVISQESANTTGAAQSLTIQAQNNSTESGKIGGSLYLNAGIGQSKGNVSLTGTFITLESQWLKFTPTLNGNRYITMDPKAVASAAASSIHLRAQTNLDATGTGGSVVLIPGRGLTGDYLLQGKIEMAKPGATLDVTSGRNLAFYIDLDLSGVSYSIIKSGYTQLKIANSSTIEFLLRDTGGCNGIVASNSGGDAVDLGFRSTPTFPAATSDYNNPLDANYPNIRMEARSGQYTINAGELRLGKVISPSVIVGFDNGVTKRFLRNNGMLEQQDLSGYPAAIGMATDAHSIYCSYDRTVGNTKSGTSSITLIPNNFEAGPSVRFDKLFGAFSLTGSTNTKTLTFSQYIHGDTPTPLTALTGKFLLGWTGNTGYSSPSCGAAIEFLVSIFINSSGNIEQSIISTGATTPSTTTPINGFTSLNKDTAFRPVSPMPVTWIPFLPEVILTHGTTTFTITIRAANNGASYISRFHWMFEYGGQFS